MPTEVYRVAAVIGLLAGASWFCWKSEEMSQLHPKVKIGCQIGVVALVGFALARMFGLV